MDRIRRYIVGSLRTGGFLTLVLVVAVAMWALLVGLGDKAGGEGAKGVALVTLVCWVLNFVTLVVLLAFAQLGGTQGEDELE